MSLVIFFAHVEGVSTRACVAPAALASWFSFLVSRVVCEPVPAMTSTFWKPFSSRVSRVSLIANVRSSWERCCASPLDPCTRIPFSPLYVACSNEVKASSAGNRKSMYLRQPKNVCFDRRNVKLFIFREKENRRDVDAGRRRERHSDGDFYILSCLRCSAFIDRGRAASDFVARQVGRKR